jgi:hypothetical protein
VLANVERGLEQEGRKRGGIRDASCLHRLKSAPQSLLRNVLGLGRVAKPPRGEVAQSIPEPLEPRRDIVRFSGDSWFG